MHNVKMMDQHFLDWGSENALFVYTLVLQQYLFNINVKCWRANNSRKLHKVKHDTQIYLK